MAQHNEYGVVRRQTEADVRATVVHGVGALLDVPVLRVPYLRFEARDAQAHCGLKRGGGGGAHPVYLAPAVAHVAVHKVEAVHVGAPEVGAEADLGERVGEGRRGDDLARLEDAGAQALKLARLVAQRGVYRRDRSPYRAALFGELGYLAHRGHGEHTAVRVEGQQAVGSAARGV